LCKHCAAIHRCNPYWTYFTIGISFLAMFAYAFLGEILTIKGYVGTVILLLSVLIAELDFKKKDEAQSVCK